VCRSWSCAFIDYLSSNCRSDGALLLRKTILSAALFVPAIAALSNADEPATRSTAAPDASEPTAVEIDYAARLATDYLENHLDSEGRFVYTIDTSTSLQAPSYNIVRHAGTMYALAMYEQARSDPQAIDAIVRAATFLRRNYVGPLSRDLLAFRVVQRDGQVES